MLTRGTDPLVRLTPARAIARHPGGWPDYTTPEQRARNDDFMAIEIARRRAEMAERAARDWSPI